MLKFTTTSEWWNTLIKFDILNSQYNISDANTKKIYKIYKKIINFG